MKKFLFKTLNQINKLLLPSYVKKDPSKLTKMQQAIVAFRYYCLVNSLD